MWKLIIIGNCFHCNRKWGQKQCAKGFTEKYEGCKADLFLGTGFAPSILSTGRVWDGLGAALGSRLASAVMFPCDMQTLPSYIIWRGLTWEMEVYISNCLGDCQPWVLSVKFRSVKYPAPVTRKCIIKLQWQWGFSCQMPNAAKNIWML